MSGGRTGPAAAGPAPGAFPGEPAGLPAGAAREAPPLLYRLIRALFAAIMAALFRRRVEGAANVPPTGPVILAANHTSWWDPPHVAVSVRRQVYFMAKIELFRYPLFGRILAALGAFPVRRGTADRRAFARSLRLLEQGRVVGMFPEGTRVRTGRLGPLEPGVAVLALKSGAPVVPVANVGPYRPFGLIAIRFGPPMEFPQYYGGKVDDPKIEAVLRAIADAIGGLMGQAPAAGGGRDPEVSIHV